MLTDAEDALDGQLARGLLEDIRSGAMELVSGAALDARLSALMDD